MGGDSDSDSDDVGIDLQSYKNVMVYEGCNALYKRLCRCRDIIIIIIIVVIIVIIIIIHPPLFRWIFPFERQTELK